MSNLTILYSANTWLAYTISKKFYRDEHWVWCSPHFDAGSISRRDYTNPPSSTPGAIYEELRNATSRGDQHNSKIAANKVGLLKGIIAKKNAGVINEQQAKEIESIIDMAQLIDFRPLMYVIPAKNEVLSRLTEVPVRDRAHPLSIEYVIENLPREWFDIIEP